MRIGIIGTGRIAERFVKTINFKTLNSKVVCIFNPHQGSSEKFVEKMKNELPDCAATDDISFFMNNVDAVYIASPHETHYEYARKMLKNGIHVLCEKPLALDEKKAKELFQYANEHNLVLMEAIKTAYCPGFIKLNEVVRSGIIGDIRDIEATFTRLTDRDTREYNDLQYGGSFLEFGSYVMLPVLCFLGCNPKKVAFQSFFADTGVDEFTKVHFEYENSFATIKTGIGAKSEGQLIISGTKGYILVHAPWWMTTKFEVRYENPNIVDEYESDYIGSGLQYEMLEFLKQINDTNRTEELLTSELSCSMADIFHKFLQNKKEYK